MPENQDGLVSSIDTRSLAERVYEQLRQSLLQGKLRAGQSVTIRSMAEALGTSEMPVREALKRLLAERMIVQRPNRTYQVPGLKRSELDELIGIRVSIEGSAAKQAVANADDALIGRLTRYNLDMKSHLEANDQSAVLRNNQEFHFALYSAAKSEILIQLIEVLWMRSGPYLAEALFGLHDSKALFLKATETHEKLINALISKNEEDVFEALKEDLESMTHWYEEHTDSEKKIDDAGKVPS